MKKLQLAGLLAMLSTLASAGGIDRSGQGLGALFEKGRYMEISLNHVMPSAQGVDLAGGATGDVTGDYTLPSFSVKFDATDTLSLALVADQTYGGNIRYGANSPLLGGTKVAVTSHALLGLARYRLNEVFSVHGGLRVQKSTGRVGLQGLAYGPVSGYEVQLEPDMATGRVLGVAFEQAAIALRVAATYHEAIKHQFKTRETASLAPLNGVSTTTISTPRAVNLDFQTGVNADTLLFGQLRWVNWSEFRVDPALFVALTGEGLIELKDTRTWTLGLARKLNNQWAIALSGNYEAKGGPLNSPLSPVNGRHGLTLAGIYSVDQVKITAGVSYIKLGDAKLETGTPDTQRATMSGNSTLAVGVNVGWGF